MRAEVKTLSGEAAGEVELDDAIFGLEPRADILHRVVNWQLAKRRAGAQSTKTRSEVRGTRKKIYRQKGTGSARHGDRYSNIFRGGGLAHAPKPRDHAHDLPKKVRKLGLRHALSAKARAEQLIIVDSGELADAKTKTMKAALDNLGLASALIIDGVAVNQGLARAARNLPGAQVMPSVGANVYDILKRDALVLTRAGLADLEARLK